MRSRDKPEIVLPRPFPVIQTMVDHPTASWDAMQDGKVFYRRQQIYSIPGKLPRLDDFVVAGCKYGGPLGMARSGAPHSSPTSLAHSRNAALQH